jgi:hypothetical protein
MENTFNKWGNFYYIFVPGYGVLKTSDLSNPNDYKEFYQNSELINLYIDHKGDLIGKEWHSNTVYYRKSPKK